MDDRRDPHSYELDFQFTVPIQDDDDDEADAGCVFRFSAEITRRHPDREDHVTAGYISLISVDVASGLNAGINPYDLMDSVNDEIAAYGRMLFDDEGDVRKEVSRSFPNADWIGKVLIIHTVKVYSDFGGPSTGLLLARKAMQVFGGDAIVIIEPSRFQHGGRGDPGSGVPAGEKDKGKGQERTQRKLEQYWKRLGFKQIGRTGCFAIDNTDELPSIKKILGKGGLRSRSATS